MKKIILSASMLVIFTVAAFAESGFEAILNVPIGVSIGVPSKSMKTNEMKWKGGAGFDIGVAAQLGYMIQAGDTTAVSILAELGYAYDTVKFKAKMPTYEENGEKYGGGNAILTTPIHSLQLGLLPKFNINGFSVGLGGGIKIPMAVSYTMESVSKSQEDKDIEYSEKMTRKLKVKDAFTPQIIGYIKATFDYSIFLSDLLAVNTGIYLGYDFIPKSEFYSMIGKKESVGAFDMGVQVGFRFGPKPY